MILVKQKSWNESYTFKKKERFRTKLAATLTKRRLEALAFTILALKSGTIETARVRLDVHKQNAAEDSAKYEIEIKLILN